MHYVLAKYINFFLACSSSLQKKIVIPKYCNPVCLWISMVRKMNFHLFVPHTLVGKKGEKMWITLVLSEINIFRQWPNVSVCNVGLCPHIAENYNKVFCPESTSDILYTDVQYLVTAADNENRFSDQCSCLCFEILDFLIGGCIPKWPH